MAAALLAALLAATLLACAGPARAFVKRSKWEDASEVSGLPRCNPRRVSFQESDIGTLRTVESPLAPKRYKTRSRYVAKDMLWDPLERSSQVAYVGSAIFYFDTCRVWSADSMVCEDELPNNEQRVYALELIEQNRELFSSDYDEEGASRCLFDISGAPPVPHAEGDEVLSEECYIFRLFQKPFEEKRLLVTFDSRNPTHLSSSPSKFVGWTESLSENESLLRVFDIQKRFMLSDDLLNDREVFARSELVAESAEPTRRELPVFCGNDFLLYQGSRGDKTSIFMRNMNSPALEAETVATSSHFPVASTVSDETLELSSGRHQCTAAWVHVDTTTVTLLALPSRETASIPLERWGQTSPFTQLVDLAIAGDYVFAVLFSAELEQYKIRYASVLDPVAMSDVEGSLSNTTLKFYTTTSNAVLLYTKRGMHEDGRDNEMRLVRFSVLGNVHCIAEAVELRNEILDNDSPDEKAAKIIVDAAVFHDSILWIGTYNTIGYDTRNKYIELIDLDKDNDDILDVIDEFPFNHGFTFDADQDGYADEIDFLNYNYRDLNDDALMYIAFFFLYVFIGLFVFAISKYSHYLQVKRQEYLQNLQEDTDVVQGTQQHAMGSIFFLKAKMMQNNHHHQPRSPAEAASPAEPKYSSKSQSHKHLDASPPSARGANTSKVVPAHLVEQARIKNAMSRGSVFRDVSEKMSSARNQIQMFGTNGEEKSDGGGFKRTSYDVRLRQIDRLFTLFEVLLTLLTVTSLVLAVYPSFPYGGVMPSAIRMCIWADFFSFSLFFLDLCGRFYSRNTKEYPTLLSFLKDNWYDVPALITDIPLTPLRFPELLGLFKLSRVFRLYRRFTQQAVFVSMMVKRPMLYLATFVSLIIIICAVFIKIFEQESQEEFRDFANVLWFTLVTVTTVGYGDYQVKEAETWALTFFLMLLGIGLISTLSAFCAESILSIGRTEEMKREMRSSLHNEAELLRVGLMHISEPYNPLSATLKNMMEEGDQFFKQREGHRRSSRDFDMDEGSPDNAKARRQIDWIERNYDTVGKHRSSTLNVTVGMESDLTLPIERIMEGAGGKFRISAISSQADLIRAVSKEYDQGMLLHVLYLQNSLTRRFVTHASGGPNASAGVGDMTLNKFSNLDFSPRTRLHFILLRFSLHKPERGGVLNFSEMSDELADIIFEPKRPLGNFLEKIFSINEEWQRLLRTTAKSTRPQFYHFDFQDPIQDKLVRIDEHFERYGINQRTDYNEIITEIEILLVLHDRVSTVEWALTHLQYRSTRSPPKPVFEELAPPFAEMPSAGLVLTQPMQEQSDKDLDIVNEEVSRPATRAGVWGAQRRNSILRARSKYVTSG
mmetsp:Transcript_24209/g.77300  ORF Transcript_24209/g.77300 Transcript_24209/m.77300 type:complete len:1340 (+) Transcript_24209:2-4021(+)